MKDETKTENAGASKSGGMGESTAWIFSGVGIVILLVITIGINMIASSSSLRKDFTEDKIFTLSQGTRNILKKLDTPVTIRFFATKDQENMPPVFRSFARRIEDMLSEYEKVGGKFVKVEKYDPEPLSDAEDLAKLDGIEPQSVDMFDQIYLGLSVRMLDETASIPFLALNRENLLEYDITRMISQVTTPKKARIGIISSLPVFGNQANPMMMQMGQRNTPPWIAINQLKQIFEVSDLTTTVTRIPEGTDVLVVMHPKDLGEETLYAIDQYVMGGGKLIVMVDPAANVDQSATAQNQMQALMQNGSNFEKLFSAWGITFSSQVVADRRYATEIRGRSGQPEERPGILSLEKAAFATGDILTSDLDSMLLIWSGEFSGTPVEGIKMTNLIESSGENQMAEAFMIQMSAENILKDFNSDTKKHVLSARLEGTFPSAFPDGKPASSGEEAPPESAEVAHLSKSTGKPSVLLVGDVDFIFDQYAFRVMNFFGQQVAQPQNGNSGFFLSMVEQMSGDENLIAIRGRATLTRPFTKFKELRLEAENRVKDEQKNLQSELEKAQEEINRLQSLKQEGTQKLTLSPEQTKLLQEFRTKEFDMKKQLKEIQKKLDRDTEAVQRNWQVVQIVLVPLLVTLLGAMIAVMKRVKTAAR